MKIAGSVTLTAPPKLDKVPITPRTGTPASSTDPDTWDTFAGAQAAVDRYHCHGIGFVFTLSDAYYFLDLDECFEHDGITLQPWARLIVDRLHGKAYIEHSPSGLGLHLIGRGTPPSRGHRNPKLSGCQLECYFSEQYATMTGDVFEHNDHIGEDSTEEVTTIHREHFGEPPQKPENGPTPNASPADDLGIVARCQGFANHAKFDGLMAGSTAGYASASEADAALLEFLLFANGGDIEQAVHIACTSRLWRAKWKTHRGDTDWITFTARNVLDMMTEFYDPSYRSSPANGGSSNGVDPTSEVARLRAENERLRAERELFAHGVMVRDGIRENTGLGNSKDTAAALFIEATTAHKAGRVDEGGWFWVQIGAQNPGNPAESTLAELSGRSDDTVRADLNQFAKAGLMLYRKVTVHVQSVNTVTGEITRGPRTRSYVKLLCPLEDLGQRLTTLDLSSVGRKTPLPKICPNCKVDAGPTIARVARCKGCGHETPLPDLELPPTPRKKKANSPKSRINTVEPSLTVSRTATPKTPSFVEPQHAGELRDNHSVRMEPQLTVSRDPSAANSPPVTTGVAEPSLGSLHHDPARDPDRFLS